jgi:hypothetical protein
LCTSRETIRSARLNRIKKLQEKKRGKPSVFSGDLKEFNAANKER